MKVTSVFIKYLNYACKITWIEFPITLCLVKNYIQISKRKHSVTSRFIWEAIQYKQLELVSHRDIQTLEKNVWKHSRFALLFSYIVFSCLDIPVKHSLSFFIYYFTVCSKLVDNLGQAVRTQLVDGLLAGLLRDVRFLRVYIATNIFVHVHLERTWHSDIHRWKAYKTFGRLH
jgi:hypothetical protein